MERDKVKIENFNDLDLASNPEDEFYDALDSSQSSSEQVSVSRTPILKEFSPITKMYSSETGFKTSDFSSTSSLSYSQTVKALTSRQWKAKDLLKKHNKDYYEFYNLSLIQEFAIRQLGVVIIEFSPDSRFLCIAGEDPQINLHEVCRQTFNESEQFLLYDEPLHVYSAHTSKVSSAAWFPSGLSFASSSLDGMVYKWDVAQSSPVGVFKHKAEVAFLATHPLNEDFFLTGCKDQRVRIWNLNNGRVESDFSVNCEITAGKFTPSGLIVVGLSVGMVYVLSFNCFSKGLEMVRTLDCRNTRGPKRSGRKITGFDFYGELCLISSNDSRIRLFDLESFEIRQKYKGHRNEGSMVAASIGGKGKFVISGSENGGGFIWNLKNITVPKINPMFTKKKRYKNSSYEVVLVDKNKNCSTALFAPDRLIDSVQRRYNAAKKTVDIQGIVLLAQKGVLFVFYNKVTLARKNSGLNKSFN